MLVRVGFCLNDQSFFALFRKKRGCAFVAIINGTSFSIKLVYENCSGYGRL
jgi:hypothetical protein